MINPFDAGADPDRHHIWERLIIADSAAFAAGDWSMIAGDFDAENFEGLRCAESANVDLWNIFFPRLEDYRDTWLSASRDFLSKQYTGMTHFEAVLARARMTQIDISGDRALAHKKFFGELKSTDGTTISGNRQTLYRLHRRTNGWKIVGFLGYLPLEL